MRRAKRHAQAGFTLLEVIIALLIFSMLALAATEISVTTTGAYRTGSLGVDLQDQAHRSLDRIVEKLRSCRLDVLDPKLEAPLSSSWLEFQEVTGFVGTDIVWGVVHRVEFRLDPEENDNGLDDDNDGLVDEGRLVLIENAGALDEREIILCKQVRALLEGEEANGDDDNDNDLEDEPGFAVDFQGETVTLHLTLEDLDHRGATVTRTVEASIKLRN